ncbi:MAG: nucleotidyl transferase AbiEii/AbiGii toxin family protein [Deltaproteobacteria bacterium]|nr:nucleotidyl transferase AbiEii/AbiGii toxin family protein [Deltaproteobacteria bacterium]
MQAGGRYHMRPVIEKELLHYDILFALDKEGLLDQLTFQGGTSLRLCYGSQRFSEDLDFVGGLDFATEKLLEMKSSVEHYIGKRYGVEVYVKEPKETAQDHESRELNVDRWQIRVATSPDRRDLPKKMIKIEVVNVPAYTREPLPLRHNYDFLPDGYSDTLIFVESLDEIMADKLISLVDCRAYVRHKDIWDLRWLRQQGAMVNPGHISKKLNDYNVIDYKVKVDEMIERLPGIINGKDFRDQMLRFIPIDVQERTLLKKKFLIFLENETIQLLKETGKLIAE